MNASVKRRGRPRGRYPKIFVAHPDDTFSCEECLPPEIDVGDPDVEVWQCFSDGWLDVVRCTSCGTLLAEKDVEEEEP